MRLAIPALVVLIPLLLPRTAYSKGPRLFLLQPEKKSCVWTIGQAPFEKFEVVNSTIECPEHILFQRDFTRAWYFEGKNLVEAELSEKGENKVLAKFDLDPKTVQDFYRDEQSGELRVIGMVVNPPVRSKGKGKKLVFLGKEHKPLALKWGVDAVAFVLAVKDGKWVLRESAASRTGGSDTPGVKVIAGAVKRRADSVSLRSLLTSATCAAQNCVARFPTDWSPEGVAARIGVAYGNNSKIGYFPFDEHDAIVAQALIDSTTVLFSPPIRCVRKCQQTHRIRLQPDTSSQISVEVRGEWALISSENRGTGAVVVNQDRSIVERSLPAKAIAVWLP